MKHDNTPRTGGCRCGKVRFSVTAPALLTMACHCRGCQRMTASAFSLSAAVPSDGFVVLQGEPALGGLQKNPRHYFCPDCKSWLFSRVDGMDWFVTVRTTMFDDVTGFEPFIETWTSEKLGWATTPARYGFTGFPSPSEFEEVSRQFAEQR